MTGAFETLRLWPHFGSTLAAGSGLAWAVAVILFRVGGRRVGPLALNLAKNALGLVMVTLLALLLGRPLIPNLPAGDYALMLLSGFIGIAVSDTLFLWALNLLGASLVAVVDSLYSPFVIGLSFLFLDERLSALQLAGVGLIVSAVLSVSRGRTGDGGPATRRDLWLGIVLGILAMLTVAVGIVMIKPILSRVPVVLVTEVRLVGGLVPLAVAMLAHRRRREWTAPLLDKANWKVLAAGSFFGSFLSLLFWVGGMKYSLASIAAALNQLNTIFIVILAVVLLRERLTARKIVAVLLAFTGAYLASARL